MANHVYTNINITFESNDASNKYIQDVLQYDKIMKQESESIKTYWDRISVFQDEYFKIICPDVESTRDDYIEKLGAKWISFDDVDFDDNELTLNMHSAWSPAFGLFERIYNHAKTIDPEVSLVITWEDEGYNFIGAASYNGNGDDWEEYVPTEEEIELLTSDDPEEDRSDEFYEAIADHMCNLTDSVLYNTSFGTNQDNNVKEK